MYLWLAYKRGILSQCFPFGMDFLGCLGSLKRAILFVCARASDLESGSAFEISKTKIKNLEKSSILFNMRSFLKEKMEKHVEDL